jgi:hypothetical protein
MYDAKWQPRCELPEDLVRPVRLDPTGITGPTRGQARGPHFRQTSHGWYVPSEVDSTRVEQRILEQSMRIIRRGGVGGWASLRWRGANYFDGLADGGRTAREVPILIMHGGRRGSAALLGANRFQLAATEREFVHGIWASTIQRSLFDEMRFQTPRRAACALEMTAAAGLISVALFAEYVAHRRGWTGVPMVRKVISWCGDCSRSGPETLMKLVWLLDAGLPMPLINVPVFSLGGRLLGYPDLFDPLAGMVGEYNGVDHKSIERHRSDVAREERYRDHGLEYFTVVGGDLRDRDLVVKRMLATRQRALFQDPGCRRWTLTPPSWFQVEEPLDHRLRRLGLTHALTHA